MEAIKKCSIGLAALICTLSGASAWAKDLNHIQDLAQGDFKLLTKDLGAAMGYKALGPAEPLGVPGFDVGLAATATQTDHTDVWNTATGSTDFSDTLYVPKLQAVVGLPLDIDVGAFYSTVPSTNISLWGGELKYAILAGGTVAPAIAVRGSFTRMTGVDQLEANTTGLDLSISKGVLFFTPYAGAGYQWIDAKPQGAAGSVLSSENIAQSRIYLGVGMSITLLNFALEYDSTGGVSSYSGKVGLRF